MANPLPDPDLSADHVLRTTRAVRKRLDFDRPVPDDLIRECVGLAMQSPSGSNNPTMQFVVVRDPAVQTKIHDLTEAAWNANGRAFSETRLTPELLKEVDEGIAGGGYRTAPVLVVVCADLERGLPATVGSSIFPCVQNLLLAAGALGLGSALTTLGAAAGAPLAALLGLPDHVVPQAIVPLGHPVRPLGPPRREPVAEHTHRDRYGTAW